MEEQSLETPHHVLLECIDTSFRGWESSIIALGAWMGFYPVEPLDKL